MIIFMVSCLVVDLGAVPGDREVDQQPAVDLPEARGSSVPGLAAAASSKPRQLYR